LINGQQALEDQGSASTDQPSGAASNIADAAPDLADRTGSTIHDAGQAVRISTCEDALFLLIRQGSSLGKQRIQYAVI
jgi:hypothetical protein